MLRSMTSFARLEEDTPHGFICWELRTVNHRYLDLNVRLPEEFRGLDPVIREQIGRSIKRGKLDCNLRFQSAGQTNAPLKLNLSLAKQLVEATQDINQLTGDDVAPKSLEILAWPGVVEMNPPNVEALKPVLLSTLGNALSQLVAHREREGDRIVEMLRQRCDAIQQEVIEVRTQVPEILAAQRKRLHERLTELLEQIDTDRVEQEIVMLAQKMDIAEEIDRLDAHLAEIRDALDAKDPVGRRLDFLIQELHREANTLGSKSIHTSTSHASVNLKVLIEQMREQVQNVE